MRRGAHVRVTVDSCDKAVDGHVDSIQRGAGQAFGILPPENATGNAVRFHSDSSPLGSLSGAQASAAGLGRPGTDIKLYSAGFDATWEIDLFGQVRRSVEAARAGTEAARWQIVTGNSR